MTVMAAGKLSPTELSRIGDLLRDAADEFANHSYNDFSCRATAENKVIFIAIARWQAGQPSGDPDPTWIENIERVQTGNGKIVSFDNWAMGYFAQRCGALAKGTASEPALSPAELGMIAAVLDLMAEFREIELKDRNVTVDYTLSAADENKQFIAAVIRHEGCDGWQDRVAEAMQSDTEIAVPEHWVMRYFSDRCRELTA
jgi:hypothetical protein